MLQEEYFNTDEFRDTLSLYEQAMRNRQSIFLDAIDLTDIAEYYYQQGQRARAMQVLDHALYLYPNATVALAYKARIALWENGNVGKARQLMAQCDDTTSPEYYLAMAEVMLADGKDDEAHRLLQLYVETMDPEERDNAVLDAMTLLVDYSSSAHCDYWLNLKPKKANSIDYLELSAHLVMLSGKPKEARTMFERVVELDPFHADAWKALAECCIEENNLQRALEAINFALAIDRDDSHLLFRKALCYLNLQNYRDALSVLQQLQKKEDDDTAYVYPIAFCLVQLQRTEEAIALLSEKAQHTHFAVPFFADFYRELADFCQQEGQTQLAQQIRQYQQQAERIRRNIDNYNNTDE